jgi:homocitrate synthase NifV
VYEKLQVEFQNDEEANEVLELVRYANVHNQKPIVDDELIFIAEYPDIAKKLFKMDP